MRARVFRAETGVTPAFYQLVAEVEVGDVNEVMNRPLEAPGLLGRELRPGDIVFLGDLYFKLTDALEWKAIEPGRLTRELYRLVARPEGLP